jgi:DNA polymerase-3 subunit beta
MVMPKNNDRVATFDGAALGQAIRRVALMSDERTRAIRLHLVAGSLDITAQTAEEGEAKESVATDYAGEEIEIGFNAQYLQDFLNVVGDSQVAFEFKDGNSQAQMRLASDPDYEYKYVIMPMRL